MAPRMRKGVIPRTPLNTSILVLLMMVGVSLFATFDIRVSLGKAFESRQRSESAARDPAP